MRYARVPIDLPESLGLNRLSDSVECTFWRLFLLAARWPREFLGFLIDERGRPWSERSLARLTLIPRSTLQRHVPQLLHQCLVRSTLGGTLFLPSVLEVEHRLASSPKDHDDGRHEPRWRRERPVENQLPLPLEDTCEDTRAGPPWPTSGPPPVRGVGHGLEVDLNQDPYVSSCGKEAVQNLAPQGPPLLADAVLSVPLQIADPDCRYMLAKLSQRAPAWGRVLADPQERANLVRLFEAHGGALLGALQSAAFDPGLVRNPGAWLNRTVPAIARETEVAS